MKIGIMLHFFDFRNDFRRVVSLLSEKHDVVLFINEEQLDAIQEHLPSKVEIRYINERTRSIKNKFWGFLFSKFGQIPKSFNNYYLMERFLIYAIESRLRRLKALAVFDLSIMLPKWLSYDAYLDGLEYSSKTPINDIDKFICLTRISDDFLFARLIAEKRDIQVYVYSWDHPCKHRQFSKRVVYKVWNKGIKEDLISLQSIPPENIDVLGASQFCYLEEFLSQQPDQQKRHYEFDYIYFGCFAGIPAMVKEEVAVVKKIGAILKSFAPHIKLVVRPYPVLRDWSYYDTLKEDENIIIDDDFKTKDLSTSEDKINDKFMKIHHAKAFFHMGTTMGLEACFTNTPSFIIDFGYTRSAKDKLSIRHGIYQYQNEKYLINASAQNVLDSEEKLINAVKHIDTPDFVDLNKKISSKFDLLSFQEFSEKLVSC